MLFDYQYKKLINQADDIYDLSRNLESEISRLENLLERIKIECYGPASTAFQKQLIMLIADMKTTRKNMSSLSTTIKNKANKLRG